VNEQAAVSVRPAPRNSFHFGSVQEGPLARECHNCLSVARRLGSRRLNSV
jgi:hypothetical protein